MRKFLIIFFLVILTLCGCLEKPNSIEENTPTGLQEDLFLSVPHLYNRKPQVYHHAYGKLTQTSTLDSVVILSASGMENQMLQELYLLTVVEENVLTYSLGIGDTVVFKNGYVETVDVNDDGIDEILLFMEVSGNGATLAQIFSIQNDEIVLLYDLSSFDLGLNVTRLDDDLLLLENDRIGFSQLIQIFDPYLSEDTINTILYLRPIDNCSIDYSSNDRFPIISCNRLFLPQTCIGELQFSLKYCPETGNLTIIELNYSNKTGDGSVS